LLREVARRLRAGETIEGEKQDEAGASWAAAPSPSDCAIRWSWPTEKVLRRIHALAPLPGAFTEIHGRVVTLLAARPSERFPRALLPGEAAVVAETAVVLTGDGAVELVSGEVDGALLDAGGLARLVARGGDLVIG
jgi:methionyl-tRNA formyltransferase